jgi:heme/copper-type cytochrome/quinol oxidase subunit 2
MMEPQVTEFRHFTTRLGFAVFLGLLVLALYSIWAVYGAAPTSLSFLVKAGGEKAVSMGHGGHGGGSMSPEEFAELTEKFVEDLSLEDGSVRPTRQWMSSMAAMGDEHAESEGEAHGKASSGIMSSMAAMGDELAESEGAGHGMASSGEMVSGAHAKTADAHEIAARSMAEAMPAAAGEGAEEHGHDEGKGPIDVYMMAMQFSYMPEVIRLQHGVPYRFRMMSMDVNHGASIHTGFAGHIMRRPARQVVEMTMSFTEPGEYMIYCTVYCGDGHDQMKGKIIVE